MSNPAYLDVHSHLLPGIDDGCRTVADSLACVRTLMSHGFTGSICTPHVCVDSFPTNTPSNITRFVARLRQEIDAARLDYLLWSGAEVRIAPNTIAWFEEHGVPTLGPSHYVLTDFWGRTWPEYADAALEYLFDAGYQPVLAHPERMDLRDDEWHAVIDGLLARGVLLQGNLRCLAGREGSQSRERSHELLLSNRYHMLASDMHAPGIDLGDRLAGLPVVVEMQGADQLALLLGERTRQLTARTRAA